ncbi:MAG: pantetheine-phosphate adenylyltransferase [Hyphomicrobiales bacterium]
MRRVAFYSGSFDPITNGHLDVLKHCASIADEIVVGIGIHPGKAPLFSFDERANLVHAAVSETSVISTEILRVVAFDDLVVDAAARESASIIVRGLRDGTDLDYEMKMVGMNGAMAPNIPTVFLPASPSVRPITATLVRQIAKMGGDVTSFVPKAVTTALKDKFA